MAGVGRAAAGSSRRCARSMNDADIYTKTAAASEELASRDRRLQPRVRTMLIMVDGRRTVADLRAAAQTLGAPDDFLDTLLQLSLVARLKAVPLPATPSPTPVLPDESTRNVPANSMDEVERFTAARKVITDTATDVLGLRVFLFTLKVERCATIEDLRALLPEFSVSLTKARGEMFARRITDHVRLLLG